MIQNNTSTILIFGDNLAECKLIQKAVTELTREGYAQIITRDELAFGKPVKPLLLIEQDDHQAALTLLSSSLNIVPDFHLIVSQLGIEIDTPYNNEDLELLKDGIEAICTITDGPTPKFNCPCCG